MSRIITEEQFNQIMGWLAEAPAKFAFNPMTVLISLPVIAEATTAPEAK